MKKILYTALLLLSSAIMVTSCGDDDDAVVYSRTPAADVAGTYTGTLVALNTSDNTSTTTDATLTVEENGTYVISVQLESSNISKSGVANISAMSSGYPFANMVTSSGNTFGVMFSGMVTDGTLTLSYTEEVQSGRKKIITDYTFTGTKQ